MEINTIDMRPTLQKAFRTQNNIFLFALSGVYHLLITIRNRAFKKKILHIKKAPCKVISIGNITVGGSGKTPVVCFLAQRLHEKGIKVAIISRGYKRKGANKCNPDNDTCLVSNENAILVSPREAGDEPYMIAENCPGIPVIVGKDRYKGCLYAKNTFGTDIAILDDAYQHQYLYRDINILVINAHDPFGNKHVLPGGILREPLTSIDRADIILLNKIHCSDHLSTIDKIIRKYNLNAPIFKASYIIQRINALNDSGMMKKEISLQGKSALVFSGIADPSSFINTIEEAGISVKKHLIFTDHHWYGAHDIDTILSHIEGIECVITTEKDSIKLKRYVHRFPIPLFTLTMHIHIVNGEDKFIDECLGLFT